MIGPAGAAAPSAPVAHDEGLPALFELESISIAGHDVQPVRIATANSIIVTATTKNILLVLDLNNPDNIVQHDLPQPASQLVALFLDPQAQHLLMSFQNAKTFYLAMGQKKARLLERLNGHIITAVGWNPRRDAPGGGAGGADGDILLGTAEGLLLELDMHAPSEESILRRRSVKAIFTCPKEDVKTPVVGIFSEIRGKYLRVIVLTTHHFLQFSGALAAEPRTAGDGAGASGGSGAGAGGAGGSDRLGTSLPGSTLLQDGASQLVGSVAAGMASATGAGGASAGLFSTFFAGYTGNYLDTALVSPPNVPYQLNNHGVAFSTVAATSDGRQAESFACLLGASLYHGSLTSTVGEGMPVVGTAKFMPHPKLADEPADAVVPNSIVLTRHHILLLMGDQLVAFSRISFKVVFKHRFRETPIHMTADASSDTIWLATNSTIYEVVTENEDKNLWEDYLFDEQLAKALHHCHTPKQFQRVFRSIGSAAWADNSYAIAAAAWARITGNNYSFEDITLRFLNLASRPSPEQSSAGRFALLVYLLSRYQFYEKTDVTQLNLLATWITEMFLSEMSREAVLQAAAQQVTGSGAATAEGAASTSSTGREAALRAQFARFLKTGVAAVPAPSGLLHQDSNQEDHYADLNFLLPGHHSPSASSPNLKQPSQNPGKDHLDRATAYRLMASYGRTREMLDYATMVGDFERVISHHLQVGNYADALAIVMKYPSDDIFYKFAPTLMEHLPREFIEFLERIRDLDPKSLLPALMKYTARRTAEIQANPQLAKTLPNYAINFLYFCIEHRKNRDAAVHNYLLSLLAQQPDETQLLDFIRAHINLDPAFNLQYALRICTQHGHARSAVHIYAAMGLYEEAVFTALTKAKDIELAQSFPENLKDGDLVLDSATRLGGNSGRDPGSARGSSSAVVAAAIPEDLEGLRKKLWLQIAKHVVEENNDIEKAMEFVEKCPSLRIEDVLPFFGDFANIDHFQDQICQALRKYSKETESFRERMDSTSHSAELLREDIRALRARAASAPVTSSCGLCNRGLLSRTAIVFACSHAFHLDCVINQRKRFAPLHERAKIQELQKRISQNTATGRQDTLLSSPLVQMSKSELEEIASSECVLCGEIAIAAALDNPFILDTDEDRMIANSWKL
ncbi:hypothetical protein H696_01381 [Fonticula alba]|uniref:Uncharacterized protein n=1 Tax=Fonticula alba TaxID=691883 RepID=A0A058ZDI3_FONAL|nr:hypothetical protein H696_01381 [Fonticula alba]KCV71973.1 hypothetical protein H696_01381 [Fonticula alba]|eukprot:XP_009493551.1 hypothetical protein H696_01381 [Fonticula alba]